MRIKTDFSNFPFPLFCEWCNTTGLSPWLDIFFASNKMKSNKETLIIQWTDIIALERKKIVENIMN